MATFLIDFDGTCIPSLPMGGRTKYNTGADKILKRLVDKGHTLVLWTARNDSPDNPYNAVAKQYYGETSLEEAERWFRERNIPLAGINKVPDEIEKVGTSRKALGDYLIDDTAIGTPMKTVTIDYYSCLSEKEEKLKTFHVDWEVIGLLLEDAGLI